VNEPVTDLVLIKLGGSLITDKRRPATPRLGVIERLADELFRARSDSREQLILGHGSGSFAHVAAAESGLEAGVRAPSQLDGVSRTQLQAAELNHLVLRALEQARNRPFSVAPSSTIVATGGRVAAFRLEPILLALELGLLPVVYGDVVLDRRQGATICSTETILLALARRLQRRGAVISRVLWLGETDGIYDTQGRTIEEVTPANLRRVRRLIGRAAGTDVTGGMELRFDTAWTLARLGIPSWILNGKQPGLLAKALRGEEVPGTRVVALE
jgi:isopentenyl phosphate kinase